MRRDWRPTALVEAVDAEAELGRGSFQIVVRIR